MAIPLESSLDAQNAARILNLPAPASDNEPARRVEASALSADISALNNTVAEMAFDLAILRNEGVYAMSNGVAITYDDATGIDAGASSNYYRNATTEVVANFQDGDTNYSSVGLLLHCDGTNDSTTFTDNGSVGHAVTAVGNAKITTAQSKFGGASAVFDGSGDYIEVPDHASLDLGTGNFTIEGWFRLNSTGIVSIIGKGNGTSTSGWNIVINTGPKLTVQQNGIYRCVANSNHSTGVWYHFAVVRSGSTWTLYMDGVAQSTTGTSSDNLDNTTVLRIGSGLTGWSGDYNGWLDDIRITKGVARYTSNFTPHTTPHPDQLQVAVGNKTVVSPAYVAATVPTEVAFTMRYIERDSDVTLNTDLTVEISRDNGTTWSTVTLTKLRTSGTTVVVSGTVSVSGQPSGSSLRSRIKTPGGSPKDVEIVAHTLQIV